MNLYRVEKYTPEMLSVVRIVVAFLFLRARHREIVGLPAVTAR